MHLSATLMAPLLVVGALVTLSAPASASTVTASALPASPASCLARPSTAITALSGARTGSQGSRSSEVDRTWDLRGFTQTANPDPTRYPFRLDAASRVCVLGGSVIGNIPRDWPRSAWYHGTDTSAEWDGEGYRASHTPDSPWIYQHGSYVENVSDGFDPNGLANGVNHSYLDRVHARFIRDDCVEVEGDGYSPHSVTITDSLFDGCHNFISMRPSGSSHADAGTTPGRLTIEDSLAWVQPMPLSAGDCVNRPEHCPGGLGNHALFKWSAAAVDEVVVRNTVFRIDQPSAFSGRGMNWPAGTYEDVTLVWTWPRPHTDYFQVPPGVRVVDDVRVWEAAKAAWLASEDLPAPPAGPVPAVDAPTAPTSPAPTLPGPTPLAPTPLAELARPATGTAPVSTTPALQTAPAEQTAPVDQTAPVAGTVPPAPVAAMPQACAGAPTAAFDDVPRSAWYVGAVDCAVDKGLAFGTTRTTYAPARDVTRAQMASFLNRILLRSLKGATLPAAPDQFGDDDSSPHEAAINALAHLGVLNGTAPGAYSPQATVTRAQMASMLVRLQELVDGPMERSGVPFSDVAASPHAAAIDKVFTAGITTGTSASTFTPDSGVRRDGMSVFLVRSFGELAEAGAVS